ncbi:MAG: hypothetical protein WDN31_12645 [Hyphomicrobium sp.]
MTAWRRRRRFIRYSLDYDPNNVYLVIDGYNALTTAARTPNQYAVANALDKFPSDNPLYSIIVGGSVADASRRSTRCRVKSTPASGRHWRTTAAMCARRSPAV